MRTPLALLAALLIPLSTALALAGPASAATSALSVTTLGRAGGAVATDLQVVNTKTGFNYEVTSGHAVHLPHGTYDVIADIFTPADQSDTIAARRVTLSGSRTVTLDARRGQALRARLSPAAPAGYQQRVLMSVCATGEAIQAYSLSDVIYVVPSSSRAVELAYSSTWKPADDSAPGARYLAATVHRGGVPSGGTMTFRQSSLATLTVSAHRGPQSGTSTIQLDGRSATDDACASGTRQLWARASLPSSFTAHVTAGAWSVSADGQDYLAGARRNLQAGHRYGVTVNAASWGPSGELPYTWSGKHIYLNTTTMFADPGLHEYSANASASYRLTRGGKTVYHRTGTAGVTVEPTLTKRGWYTLSIWAHRHPRHRLAGDALSTAAGVTMRFYVDPTKQQQMRGYLTGFRPAGLSARDQARPSTTTTVALELRRDRPREDEVQRQSDAVRKVAVQASVDGGRTWHAVAVRHAGSRWTAAVHNPASGYVSLRSTVKDTHGSATTTTVMRAYGIG